MSWLKKLWRGEAAYWQAFWLCGILVYALGVIIGGGMAALAQNAAQSVQLLVPAMVICVMLCFAWLVVERRNAVHAKWRWSQWPALALITLWLFQATLALIFTLSLALLSLDNDKFDDQVVECQYSYNEKHQLRQYRLDQKRMGYLKRCIRASQEAASHE